MLSQNGGMDACARAADRQDQLRGSDRDREIGKYAISRCIVLHLITIVSDKLVYLLKDIGDLPIRVDFKGKERIIGREGLFNNQKCLYYVPCVKSRNE